MSHHHDDVFERFAFFVLPTNTSGSVSIPLSASPTTLATITIHSDRNDVIFLTGTVGWRVVTNGTGLNKANVLFQIRRNAVGGSLIFSADDSGEANADNNRVTSFDHVDTGIKGRITYFLTAQLTDAGSAATVIGPITFTATEIERFVHDSPDCDCDSDYC
jgi:hypothetical protein